MNSFGVFDNKLKVSWKKNLIEKDNKINIFFDNKTFNLIGWQTKDIYQNINITYLSSIKTNQKIAKNLFKLPSQN